MPRCGDRLCRFDAGLPAYGYWHGQADASERQRVPFHLVDVADPDAEWTLADFQEQGEAALAEIEGRGRNALIVGGTGLYVRALTTRLDIPTVPPDEELRARWRAVASERGNAFLQAELAKVDPEAAARIHVNDVRRLIRALEVQSVLGISLSELHAQNRAHTENEQIPIFGLSFADRRSLYGRIETRVDQMLADGFLDEVRGLLAAGYPRGLKPMQSLGYRHLAAYLTGETDLGAAIETLKQDTRRFARRQLIWFRGDTRIIWITADGKTPLQMAAEIETLLIKQGIH